MNLIRLSNGKQVDSRIYPSLQKMFNDARASGLAIFVREGYRTFQDQQQIIQRCQSKWVSVICQGRIPNLSRPAADYE